MSKDKDVKIRPLDDRVVVETLEAEEKTAGGILLPDSAKQKPQRGRIVAIGAGKMLDNGTRAALAVAKGDEVIYGKYSGNDIKIENKEYKILRETDILAKVVKSGPVKERLMIRPFGSTASGDCFTETED